MKRPLKFAAAMVGTAVVVVSLAFLIAAHRATAVLVVDEAGMPLADAEVVPQSLSINYASKTTDRNGVVRLPLVPQTVHWISVRKKGYQDYQSADIEHVRRVVVILRKASQRRDER